MLNRALELHQHDDRVVWDAEAHFCWANTNRQILGFYSIQQQIYVIEPVNQHIISRKRWWGRCATCYLSWTRKGNDFFGGPAPRLPGDQKPMKGLRRLQRIQPIIKRIFSMIHNGQARNGQSNFHLFFIFCAWMAIL